LVWRFFAASFVAGVGIVAGLILLVIPGIFLLVRLSMTRFAVVEGAGIIGSLRRSWRQTRGHGWRLFGFFLTLIGINIVGALLLFVGLLVSVPVSMLAWAHVYHKLKNHA
jgi:uncharacterized membrane protein